jgi:hypothetical protein
MVENTSYFIHVRSLSEISHAEIYFIHEILHCDILSHLSTFHKKSFGFSGVVTVLFYHLCFTYYESCHTNLS